MRRVLMTVCLVLVAAVAFAQPQGRGAVGGRGAVVAPPVIEKVAPKLAVEKVKPVKEADAEIAKLEAQMKPLRDQLAPLEARMRDLRSTRAHRLRVAADEGYVARKNPKTGEYEQKARPTAESREAERTARRAGRHARR